MANNKKIKGTKAESEFVELAGLYGVPACRVIGSGAIETAGGDIKCGVQISKEGISGGKDATDCYLRIECKNRKSTNLDWVFPLIGTERTAAKGVTDAILQHHMANVLVMRRQKAPVNSKKNMDGNQLFVIAMLGGDFLEMVRDHLTLIEENERLKRKIGEKL